jgi:hypothetical protein
MSELSKDEFWLIEVYFACRGLDRAHRITDVSLDMRRLSFHNTEEVVRSLVRKQVLSLSPDGDNIKFTDYGIELYDSMLKAQEEWENQPIIKVSNISRDQVLIRAGETFKANRVVREIIGMAKTELCILDPYIGSNVFDIIEDVNTQASIRIITSEKISNAAMTSCKAYRNQFPHIEMKILDYSKGIHDRFIIWDHAHGFHIGHSIKDLGTKDTQLNHINDPYAQQKMFEERWIEAKPIS